MMNFADSNSRKCMFMLALGTIGGGLVVAWATRAIPKMMSEMMRNMMARMQEEGCDPVQM